MLSVLVCVSVEGFSSPRCLQHERNSPPHFPFWAPAVPFQFFFVFFSLICTILFHPSCPKTCTPASVKGGVCASSPKLGEYLLTFLCKDLLEISGNGETVLCTFRFVLLCVLLKSQTPPSVKPSRPAGLVPRFPPVRSASGCLRTSFRCGFYSSFCLQNLFRQCFD